jgi:Zn-dependent peptidase ImmA (M78 family)
MNPKILQWARLTSNLTIEDVAKKTNVKAEHILAWENGEEEPTYPQLEKLAYSIYKRPIAIFFFQNPPEENVESSFRTLSESAKETFPGNIKKLLRVYKAFQYNLEELGDGINPKLKEIKSLIPLNKETSIEKLVKIIRNILGVDIQTQISWKNSDEALKNWRNSVEEKGIYIFKDAFKVDDFSGFCLYDTEFPVIVVNNSSSKNRQIFTIFHELAHLLFGTSGIDKLSDEYLSYLQDEDKKIEIYCNKFAGEFLVPEESLNSFISGKKVNEKLLSQLSQNFKVSKEVIARRLLEKGTLSQIQYRDFIKEWESDYKDFQESKKESGGDHYRNKIHYLGKKYSQLVFAELLKGRISEEKAAEYLNTKVNHIPKLEELVLQ